MRGCSCGSRCWGWPGDGRHVRDAKCSKLCLCGPAFRPKNEVLTDAQSRAEDQEETSMNWTEIALTITAVAQLIAALATLIGVIRGSP